MSESATKIIMANGIPFHTLVWGAPGPKILLLHGFPETPEIFSELAKRLVDEMGYQVFAPYMPGYGPTPAPDPDSGVVHLVDLAASLSALATNIAEEGEKVTLVGHDWGAAAAYVTAAHSPHLFDRLFTMAVPPLSAFLKSFLRVPSQWQRSAYMLAFQLRFGLVERFLARNDYQRLRKLCLYWSGGASKSLRYFSGQAEVFDRLGSLKHPLGYYRGLFPVLSGDLVRWRASIKLALKDIPLRTKIMVGALDLCIPAPAYKDFERQFPVRAELIEIAGAGHFLPLDAPEEVAEIIGLPIEYNGPGI